MHITETPSADRYAPYLFDQAEETIMTPNIGDIDRTVRIVAGLAILSLFFVLDASTRWWALAGFVPLVTGLIRWCPAYLPFHFSTRKTGFGA
jgi:Inner membrane protein YgaP-like, transmembrane domain